MTSSDLREELARHTREDFYAQFGHVSDEWIDYAIDNFWNEAREDVRLTELQQVGVQPGAKILDVASGHGGLVFRALESGFDAWGIEPDAWKMAYAAKKLAVTGRPASWHDRLLDGVGERIPFPDASFDAVTSHQTLEHVQEPSAVVAELLRVTRPGGLVHLRCPDYRSLFEGHYRLPWWPLMPRHLAHAYLQALGRPRVGLDGIQYMTRPWLFAEFRRAARAANRSIEVTNLNRELFEKGVARRGLPVLPGAYALWRGAEFVGAAFRRELQVAIVVRV